MLIDTDEGKINCKQSSTDFLNEIIFERYIRYISKGVICVGRFIRLIRDLLKKLVFEESNCLWLDELNAVKNNIKMTKQSSTNLTPTYATLKSIDAYVYQSLLNKGKKLKAKHKLGGSVRAADKKRLISKLIQQFHLKICVERRKFLTTRYQCTRKKIHMEDKTRLC